MCFCNYSVPFVLFKTKVIKFLWARAAKIYSLCQKNKTKQQIGGSFFLKKRISPFTKSCFLRAGQQ